MIAFLRDLRRPLDLVPKLRNLGKLKTAKGLSDEYLRTNYGILPTVGDIQNIFRAFKKIAPYVDSHGFETYNALHTQSITFGNSKLWLEQRIKIAIEKEDSEFKRLCNMVDSAGFSLTLENIWDLIPYSFVLDWFVNVGEFLHRVDTRLRMYELRIQYATMSRKRQADNDVAYSSTIPISGTLSMVQYSRWTSDQCPVPPLSFQNTITAPSHWLEAGALLVQRGK